MSVDGGGTKIISVLFDEHFRLLSYGTGGAINPNFETIENIKLTMEKCIKECIDNWKGIDLDSIYISMPGPYELYIDLLKHHVNINKVYYLNEGQMALLAGVQLSRGLVALAGTGSGVFWIDGKKSSHVGGWGSLLGDQGSAYYIGREGLVSAISYYEKIGPFTMLYELVMNEWGLNTLWDLTKKIYGSPSSRYVIASFAPLVSKAASLGDEVSINIFKRAGEEMAQQAKALLTHLDIKDEITATVAGGAWKGFKIMFDTFKDVVTNSFTNVSVKIPLFEPVMGGVIKQAKKCEENISCEYLKKIKDEFNAFLYKTQWN